MFKVDHSVATFFCQIRHFVRCSVSLLAETHFRTDGFSVWLNRVLQCGHRWAARFCTLLYCRDPVFDSGDVLLHNVALEQAGKVFLYVHMCINSVYTVCVCFVESRLAANCRDSVTLLLKHKAGPFIYSSQHHVIFISHPHSRIHCTSSTCICIWNMHDTYITWPRLSED